ncbi:MAG: cell envelope integrity protein TolA [Candidatus Acidiferrum sp.]
MKRYTLHLVSLLSLALAVAFLIPPRATADDDDPPGRVARLGFIRGTVSFEPAGTEDWVSAVVNRPLTTGDKLWNDNDSFSELHLGSATIRLGSNTGFSFLNLTDNLAQIRLTEGTLNIRVRRLADDETFEVDTPNLAFTLLRPGNYKVTVNEAGDATVVLVRDGQGEVTGGGSAYTVHPQEIATFNGIDQLDADVQSWDNSSDDFDDWCAERDSRIDHSVSARYVSDDVIGYEDLDEYGGWRPTPEYGTVWFPHVSIVGWAPYHYGHWVYIAPWGYTWVDDAPWGFAPFHYGRWVVVGGVWGWVPAPPRSVVVGAVYVRPVYAPALVAWVGGPHFGVGIGVGGGFAPGVNVGWFPLGPREVYMPSYHVSRAYVTNINVSNTRVETRVVNNYYNTTVVNKTTVTNVTYVNQRVPGAVMATTPQAFTSAQSVSRNSVVVNEREVASAQVRYDAPAVAPTRQAVLGAGVAVRARPPIMMENRAVVAKATPPPPPPSFERQQQAIQANGGRPLATSQIHQIQPAAIQPHSNIRMAPTATPQNIQANHGVQPIPNRPVVTPNSGVNKGVNPGGNPPATNTNVKTFGDRPPASRPNTPPVNANVNPQLEQKHQQQIQNLRTQQDLERQKIEQQQQKDRADLAKKAADDQAQQRLNQQHQQQLEALEKKHDTEEVKLKQQQQVEKKNPPKPPKPPKEEKPPKKDKQ